MDLRVLLVMIFIAILTTIGGFDDVVVYLQGLLP
jgi:hypothetical protein